MFPNDPTRYLLDLISVLFFFFLITLIDSSLLDTLSKISLSEKVTWNVLIQCFAGSSDCMIIL